MKNKYIIFLLLLTAFSFSSCIQDEAPNAECDIISVDAAWLEEHKDIFIDKPNITNNAVKFSVLESTPLEQLKELEPKFNLTAGASIKKIFGPIEYGKSGVIILYRTYSEDGNWDKDYQITFIKQTFIPKGKVFSFENYSLGNKFYTWHEIINNTKFDWWSSGNQGYVFAAGNKPATDFPTTICKEGYIGNCVKLTTCETNKTAAGLGKPIAAGNIFIGDFDSGNAMNAHLEAIKFGLQIVPGKPVSLTGYYKYTPGAVVTGADNKPIEGIKDACSIYSVLFEVDPDNFVPLNGANVTTSDRIVLIAEMQNYDNVTEWTKFNIPFEPRNGKAFDFNKLENNEYAITVVASSSKDGGDFIGAVGSTLLIDEVKIEWEQE